MPFLRPGRVLATAAAASLFAGASLVAATVTSSSAPARAAASADVVTVDPSVQYQTVQGWGTSLAWWAEGAGGWTNAGQRDRLADALFDPDKGIGLNIARYDIGGYGPGETCAAPFRTGGAVPSWEPAPGKWTPGADADQLRMLHAAVDRGADRVDAIAYSAPVWMTRNGCTQGAAPQAGQHTADNLNPADYRSFAQYLASVVTRLHDDGLPVTTIDPFNEPSVTAWVGNAKQEGMNVDEPARAAVIDDLAAQLRRDGLSGTTGISGPDEATAPASASEVAGYSLTSPDVRADLAQLNAHNYEAATTNDYAFGNLATRDDTPLWMSEWGDYGTTGSGQTPNQMGSAVQLSQRILKNENQMHPNAWVAWQGVDGPVDGGNIDDLWGLVWADITPGASRPVSCPADERDADYPDALCYPKRYWTMGNYSKYVRPGSRMVRTTDADTFATYDAGRHQLVMVATNASTSAVQRSYDLSGFASVGASAAVHLTDATHNLTTMPDAATGSGSLAVTLPPDSVTTFVVQANQHPEDAPTEIAVPGSGRATTVSVPFTGTRARLYADRTPRSGRIEVSVDGERATDVDLHATASTSGDFVYETPDLPAGAHRLTVRPTRSLPTGARVEIDGARVPVGSYVHQQAIGASRTNFTGAVGMQITTGPRPLRVSAIGRYHSAGNHQTHTVSIVRVSDGATVASTRLATGHAAVDALGYQYARLARTVELAPDTVYAVLDSEISGGDAFADSTGTVVTTAAGAAVDGAAYVDTEGVYHVYAGTPGQTYGPVSLRIDQHR